MVVGGREGGTRVYHHPGICRYTLPGYTTTLYSPGYTTMPPMPAVAVARSLVRVRREAGGPWALI